jgi:hypothetical protein
MLSNFFPNIDPDSNFTADDASKDIQNICPNLRYTCCKSDQIMELTRQLKSSIHYLKHRFQLIKKFLTLIKSIPEETFQILLNELTDADIKCYNDRQIEVYNGKVRRFSKTVSLLVTLYSSKKSIYFTKKRAMSSFLKIKKKMDSYIKKMEKYHQDLKDYYSGMVCSMCSPTFTKQFVKTKDGSFELEINSHMCTAILKRKLKYVNSLFIYKHLQNFANLLYCVRKNSKKERMDYDDITWKDYILMDYDLEYSPDYLEKRTKCVNGKNAFLIEKSAKKVSCKNECQYHLNFFHIRMESAENFIRVENDLHQVHNYDLTIEDSKKRFNKKLKKFVKIRSDKIEKGILRKGYINGRVETIDILKTVPGNVVNFKALKLSVSKHLGLNVSTTPMDRSYYVSGISILRKSYLTTISLIFSLFILNQIE